MSTNDARQRAHRTRARKRSFRRSRRQSFPTRRAWDRRRLHRRNARARTYATDRQGRSAATGGSDSGGGRAGARTQGTPDVNTVGGAMKRWAQATGEFTTCPVGYVICV